MPGQADPRNLEQIIRESEADGGSYERIAEFGWWNAVDITRDLPIGPGTTGEFSLSGVGLGPEVQFAAQAAGGPYGIRWDNSEDGIVGWNFQLPRNYMAATGATGNHRRQTWVLDVNMQCTTTANAVRARIRRVNQGTAVTLGAAVTATSGDVTVAITGDSRYTFTWLNPVGSPKDNYQLNIQPVAAIGVGDTLTLFNASLYVKTHAGFADRTTRNP